MLNLLKAYKTKWQLEATTHKIRKWQDWLKRWETSLVLDLLWNSLIDLYDLIYNNYVIIDNINIRSFYELEHKIAED